MNPRTLASSLGFLAALAGLAGCGGSVYSTGPGDSGSPDVGPLDSGGQDALGPDTGPGDSAAPWSPICPGSQPTPGSPCTTENIQCEYGDSWWSVSCDPVLQCEGGQWTTYQPSFEPCSPKPGPNPSACPADYAGVSQGASCTNTTLSCIYAQGECSCQMPLGGPVELDGGSAYWGCVPEQGCPFPRPRVGTACGTAGTSCTYEACSYSQICQDGVWQGQSEACASAGERPASP